MGCLNEGHIEILSTVPFMEAILISYFRGSFIIGSTVHLHEICLAIIVIMSASYIVIIYLQ